nr:hypothetical protein [Myxococcota bacterium]
ALEEVARLGCDAAADEATRRVALQAAHDLGGGTRTDAGGREVPASCTVRAPQGSETSDEWRPAE